MHPLTLQYTPGVLASNFTRGVIICGGNCGGIGLQYDLDGPNLRYAWFVVPKPGEPNVWNVRWTPDSYVYQLPANALNVYVFA